MTSWVRELRRALLIAGLAVAFGAGASAAEMKGGTVVWGKPNDVDSFDVHVATNGVTWQVLFLVYETLIEPKGDMTFEPLLAESWEQPSPTTYIFHLRQNAKFSNGRAVTADDVVNSLNRLRDPELGSFWAQQTGPISEIVADDGHTVRIELERPYSPLLAALSSVNASIVPFEELEAGSFDITKEMLGSGPFMVAEHLQDESWTLKRNPHYWRAGHPVVDEVKILVIPDDAARIAALRDGRVHIANFDSPDAPALLAGVPNVEAVVQQTTDYYRIDVQALPDTGSPFADARVRQAMVLGLDRQKISDVALAGTATVDYPVAAGFPSSAACHDAPSYQEPRSARVEKAKALLKEAGAEGVEVGFIASPTVPVFPLIAQVIADSLKDIGMKVNVEAVPRGEWLERSFGTGEFDMAMSWFAGYTDPVMVPAWWNPDFAKWNAPFMLKDQGLVDLLEKAKATAPGAARDALFSEICDSIDAQANMVALVGKPATIAYREDLLTVRIHAVEGYVNHFKYIEEYTLLK